MLLGDNEGALAAEEYTDMIEAGILDPAKVARTALQHAASSLTDADDRMPRC